MATPGQERKMRIPNLKEVSKSVSVYICFRSLLLFHRKENERDTIKTLPGKAVGNGKTL